VIDSIFVLNKKCIQSLWRKSVSKSLFLFSFDFKTNSPPLGLVSPIIFFVEADTGPFHIQVNYMEPMQVMMIKALIRTSKVSTPLCEEEVNHALREFEKEEEPVFPQAGKSLVDFLSMK